MSFELFIFLFCLILFGFERLRKKAGNIPAAGRILGNIAGTTVVSGGFNTDRLTDRINNRMSALNEAGIFLKPYNNIWGNLVLTNKYCSLKLAYDGVSITGSEKINPHRSFRVVSTGVYQPDELWNMWCRFFDFNKSYDGLLEDCRRFGITIVEDELKPMTYDYNANVEQHNPEAETAEPKEKFDINNCSEAELTALPGISIVLAKKTVKRREEIGGFKTLDEFFDFIKLRPHMENQLRNLLVINKMKGSLRKCLNEERSVDL